MISPDAVVPNCKELRLTDIVTPNAACVTEKVRPATLNVPDRGLGFGLEATVKLTAPDAVPPDAPVIVSHGAELTTDQPHPLPVLTVKEPGPPLKSKLAAALLSV